LTIRGASFARRQDYAQRSVKDPPRLTVESTVLDLADVREAGEVVELITTAAQRRLTTVRKASPRA
jgi:hypothetical protein